MNDWIDKVDRKLAVGSLGFSIIMILVDGMQPLYVVVILIDIFTLIKGQQ